MTLKTFQDCVHARKFLVIALQFYYVRLDIGYTGSGQNRTNF